MRNLDETDMDILRLLLEDARRPYSEIADRVGVSPPTVSDRVDRLQKLGVIRQFTLDIDRSMLNDGFPVMIEIDLRPEADDRVADRLAAAGPVERVYESADRRLVVEATVTEDEVKPMIEKAIDMELVRDFDVRILQRTNWQPQISSPEVQIDYEDESDLDAATVDRN